MYYKIIILTSLTINLFLLIGWFIWLKRRGGIKYLFEKILSLHPQVTKSYSEIRLAQFTSLPIQNQDIVFLGDSHIEMGEWSELFPELPVINRGIGGETTTGLIKRLEFINNKPDKILIMIGTNDILSECRQSQEILANYQKIVDYFDSQVYVHSILPTRIGKFNHKIQQINGQLKSQYSHKYIDLYSYLVDKDNQLDSDYTEDGIHLNGKGYLLWHKIIKPLLEE